jgi:hypothetical protein
MNFHLHLRDVERGSRRRGGRCPARPDQQFGGCWPLRAPLVRSLPPSALESGGVDSSQTRANSSPVSPAPEGPGTGRGFASAATFRPRRFYGLDGLLRHPLLPRFPAATLMGLDSPSRVFPIREDRAVTGTVIPSWSSSLRSCLRSRFRLHRRAGPPGVCSVLRDGARSRTDRHRRRLVSLSPGFVPSWASLVGTQHPERRGPVTCSEL